MKPLERFFVFLGVVAVVGVLILLAGARLHTSVPQGKMRVVTSFYPLAHIATRVGGENVIVENLLPPGGEPHDYEPSTRQLAELGTSALLIFNGAHFEPWVDKWQEGAFPKPSRTIDMVNELGKRGAPLITAGGSVDPHVWLDPVLYIQEIEIVRDALSEIDPARTDTYRSNAASMIADAETLDRRFHDGLAGCVKQDIVVSHEAFAYLARRYGFTAIPIAGISPDEEPSPRALADLAGIARAKGITAVFFETTASPRLSETVAREIGAQTLVLNPLESLTASELQSGERYETVMEKNLVNLRKALVCP